MKLAIAIPARYGSTRFPGKPLALINGKSMLQRVADLARRACADHTDTDIFICTEDERIVEHAETLGIKAILTPDDCPTGSDRVLAALKTLKNKPDFVLNLQGDAPFTPVHAIEKIFETYRKNPALEVVTPIHRLHWDDLDRLRNSKQKTPFSGTTAAIDREGRALWFSKNIIPAIRKEENLRNTEPYSPIFQHMGLYGFRTDILEKFCSLDEGTYEKLEGLEQLRMLENGIHVQTVQIELPQGHIQSGIDSPEDLARAENFLRTTEGKRP